MVTKKKRKGSFKMNSKDKEQNDEEETREAYLNFVNQNLGYDFNNELFFDFQTLEQVYNTSERKTKKEVIKEVEKMIDEFRPSDYYYPTTEGNDFYHDFKVIIKQELQKLKEKKK